MAASEEGTVALPQTRPTLSEVALWATWEGETFTRAGPLDQGWGTQQWERHLLCAASEGHTPGTHSLFFLGHSMSSVKALVVKGIVGSSLVP